MNEIMLKIEIAYGLSKTYIVERIGFKPTYGRIPLEGLIKFSESVDHIGFFTRTVKGMEIAFAGLVPDGQFKKVKDLSRLVLCQPDEVYFKQKSPFKYIYINLAGI